MSRLEDKFIKTISEYNENVSDFHKFKFSDKEKAIFLNMMREYAEECVKASLEKASENATVKSMEMFGGNFLGSPKVVDKESITSPENIILL